MRWTEAIHEEWTANLMADGRVTRERLERTLGIMRRELPDADVRGYEHRIAGPILPDPGDLHVLAAAIDATESARRNLMITTPEIGAFIDALDHQRLAAFAARLRQARSGGP